MEEVLTHLTVTTLTSSRALHLRDAWHTLTGRATCTRFWTFEGTSDLFE
jgi:hypothetical protein